MTDRRDEIDAIEELLPWYAAGTLDPADARRVEEALARMPELRASLRLVREEREETVALNESLGAPSADAWERVAAMTEAEPRRATFGSRLSPLARLVGLGARPNSARLAWVSAAAAVVVLLEGAVIVSLLPTRGEAPFRTASAPSTGGQGAEVLVAFAPDARLDQVSAWLKAHQASIVSGPGPDGFYRLRVGDKRLSADEKAALIHEIGAAPFVTMVLPARSR